jgi:predicted Zn-dependent protease
MAVVTNSKTGWAIGTLACLLLFNGHPVIAQSEGDQDDGSGRHRHHHHNDVSSQENFYRGETEADRLYREANRARFDWDAEKARSLFEEAVKAEGSARAKYKSRICLKCYIPKYPVSPDCEKAFKAADVLIQQNKLSAALAAFQTLALKYPKFEWVQLELATIHLKNEDPERAATCARRALAINPDYVDAWMILAHECLMHHDMEGARVTAQTAHELDPFSDVVSKAVSLIDDELAKKKPD